MRRIDYTNALNARVNIEKRTIPATGVDNIALPVTAANTGMKAQLFGQSAENLVVNGDFRNGTTGWHSKNLTITSTANGVLLTKVDPDATANTRSDSTDFRNISAIGDKIYTMARIRCNSTPSNNVYLAQANSAGYVSSSYSKLAANTTDWQIVSLVGELNTSGDYRYIGLSLYDTYTGTVDFDYMEVINLTATFGAGNEPIKEQCDKLFANYFEGTANTIGTGRVRSVGVGGINPSSLYFNGGTLRSNGLIKDEIRKGMNGYELVKRISDTVILNGSEAWRGGDTPLTDTIRFSLSIDGVKTGGVNRSSFWSNVISGTSITDAEIMQTYNRSLLVRINKSRLSTLDVPGFKLWLTANNQTVNYELDVPVITPISHAGLLNSNSGGTVYFEPAIKDIITYTDKAEISDTDYPISSIESIEKNGIAVNPATAVIAEGGLSLTHPDLEANDEVELIYFYNRESTGRGMRLLFYNKA